MLDWQIVILLLQLVVLATGMVLAFIQLRKISSGARLSLMTDVEAQLDLLRVRVLDLDPAVIRRLHRTMPSDFSKEEIIEAAYYEALYPLVSRYYYFLTDKEIDLAASMAERRLQAEMWIKYAAQHRQSRAFQYVHEKALREGYYNEAFLEEFSAYISRQDPNT